MAYEGAPSRTLRPLAAAFVERLATHHRCMYFNTPAMVAGLRSSLAAAGVDVERELARGSVVLVADDAHLVGGRFEIDRMIASLEAGVQQALADGYVGLFACGDMTWEFGAERDFSKLLEYEWRLEQLFAVQPALSGICQYHQDLLPRDAMFDGMLSHSHVFVNDTLTRLNPSYISAQSHHERAAAPRAGLAEALSVLLAVPK